MREASCSGDEVVLDDRTAQKRMRLASVLHELDLLPDYRSVRRREIRLPCFTAMSVNAGERPDTLDRHNGRA
jgi:hypothetical protein